MTKKMVRKQPAIPILHNNFVTVACLVFSATKTDTATQRRLVGLTAALVDLLRLSKRLPVPSELTDEEANSIVEFAVRLMKVSPTHLYLTFI